MSLADHREAVMLLNELLAVDPKATATLLGTRVPCTHRLGRSGVPLERDEETGLASVGVLDLVNALFGVHDDGRGRIAAVYGDEGELMAFRETD